MPGHTQESPLPIGQGPFPVSVFDSIFNARAKRFSLCIHENSPPSKVCLHARNRLNRPFAVATLLITSFGCACLSPAFGQNLNGTLRGVILDQQGKAVPLARVTATDDDTRAAYAAASSDTGAYVFIDLPVGPYSVRVEADGFASYVRPAIRLLSSQVTDVTVTLALSAVSAEVRVKSGADAVQTESPQLSATYQGREASIIPTATGASVSVLNLSIYMPNTTTALGGTSGTGGSVGGLRGRQNSFSIDGVDNNDPNVTVAAQPVIVDAVQEFTVTQNVYNAEYGRGSGGQFNIITKTGTSQLHFGAWLYNGNRAYDATDNQEQADIRAGVRTGKRRYDFNRLGGDIGAPVIRDKVFVYGAYEFDNLGQQATAPTGLSPTAAGLVTLNALAADSQVRALLAQFPVAPVQTTAVTVNGQQIPIGAVNSVAPSFTNQHNYIINSDWNPNPRHNVHIRFLQSRTAQPSFGTFPQEQFASSTSTNNTRVILNDVWTVSSRMVNDFKVSYARLSQFTPLTGIAQTFPNLVFQDLSSTNIGPSVSFPQYRASNEYLVGDTLSRTAGRHTLKWGGEYFWFVAPSVFLQSQRGQYTYTSLSQLINDQVPGVTSGTLQGVGNGFFSDNSKQFGIFMQDDIKLTPRLTLNLGIRYDFMGNPAGAKLNALNSVANLPGTPLVFGVPKQDRNNVGPRIGFAWDPTGSARWAIRGGAGVVYDRIPWNFYSNGLPIELEAILTPISACAGTFGPPPSWCTTHSGFLANGAMNTPFVPPTSVATARSITGQMMADAKDPKVFTWSLEVQREIFRNTTVEVRYLGTRALELPVQFQVNSMTAFENGASALPTYLNPADIPATVSLAAPTLAQFNALRTFRYSAQGFTGAPVTVALPVGASAYHGGSIELLHRFGRGLFVRANYTYSKTMDDSTNDLLTSAVNPRRPEDAYNLRNEWARSALDVPHKAALTFVYDIPVLRLNYRAARALANGWELSGSYLFQSGQPITIQSGFDANGNLDTAGDRAILNPAGTEKVGSIVNPVCRNAATGATSVNPACAAANIVGYVPANPNARYIQAGPGALTNLGRNTFRSPYFNIWNMAVSKSTKLGERMTMQLRAQAFNVFNHPDYTLGNLSVFPATANAMNQGYASLTSVPSGTFLNEKIFNSGSRRLELGLKFTY